MSTETALATLPPGNIADYFVERGLDPIIEKIRKEALSIAPDITTEKGRKEIASVARKVASSKVALDDLGKGLTEDWKARTKAVDSERKRMRDQLDALRDEVRKPLTDWEQNDEQRVKGHQDAIADIERMGLFAGEPNSTDLKQRLDRLEPYRARQWEEFEEIGKMKVFAIGQMLEKMYDGAKVRESNEADLKRLREAEKKRMEEDAQRQRAEREESLKKAAAEQAKKEAEEKAAREKADAELKAKAESDRLEREKAAAEDRALKAEQEKKDAEVRAEQARVDAQIKAEREKQAAVEAERKRAEDAKRAEEEAAKKREADIEHRKKINNHAKDAINEILQAFLGNEQNCGQAIIEAIARGKVPHVTISY